MGTKGIKGKKLHESAITDGTAVTEASGPAGLETAEPPVRGRRPRTGLMLGSVCASSLLFLLAAVFLLVSTGLPGAVAQVVSHASPKTSSGYGLVPVNAAPAEVWPETEWPAEDEETPAADDEPETVDYLFSRPDELRAVWLTAGVDYPAGGDATGEAVRAALDAAFAKLAEWGFNAVFVPFWADGAPLYSSALAGDALLIHDEDGGVFDPLAYIRKCALDRGIYVYGVIDLQMRDGGLDPSVSGDAQTIGALAAEAAGRYDYDGYLLSGIGYGPGGGGSYAAYMRETPGVDFERFLRRHMDAAVRDAVSSIKKINANLYVGLLADPVWSPASSDERGIQAAGLYAANDDGRADTLAWLEEGLFDFVLVDNGFSLKDAVSFGTVLDWWSAAGNSLGLPVYMLHAADKAGTAGGAWNLSDQLTRQVLECQKAAGWTGSAFNSMAALLRDPNGSTGGLVRALKKDIDETYIDKYLNVTSPGKASVVTYESKFTIRGSADTNFDLTINGKAAELSEYGYFSETYTLAVGKNTFTLSHKGQTTTYSVELKVEVIKDITPAADFSADGGSVVLVTAIGYRGASLKASFNGKTAAMKVTEYPESEDGAGIVSSDYDYYTCAFTLPDGIKGQEQTLGNVSVSGSYKTSSKTVKGALITVSALPVNPKGETEPLDVPADVPDPIDPTAGTGGKLGSGKLVVVNIDYAQTFRGTTSDDVSRTELAYLPMGTMGIVEKAVLGSSRSKDYYLLTCGQRVYQKNVTTYKENGSYNANAARLSSVAVDRGDYDDTRLTLGMDWRVPYNIQLKDQAYGGSYNAITDFTATYVDILFYHTTKFEGAVDLSGSPLFKSGEWISGGDNTVTLRLQLQKKGCFYGYSAYWDGNGNLIFSFRHPSTVTSGSQPLLGKQIVIDPGHGGTTSSGAVAGNFVEKEYALKFSLTLREKLEAKGAYVIMTRETDRNPDYDRTPDSMSARNAYARNNFSDLFVSMHVNAHSSAGPRGSTVFYFNEYSMELAKAVGAACKSAYNTKVPGAYNRANYYSFQRFMVMQIHDCPAILVESGFCTTPAEADLMRTEAFNQWFNDAIVEGIIKYFSDRAVPDSYNARLATSARSVTSDAALPVDFLPFLPLGLIGVPSASGRRRFAWLKP